MDPRALIGPPSPLGFPAPFWFIELFKVLGFTLHQVPMHLWYAGLPLAALLTLIGGPWGRHLRNRLITSMPLTIAVGVNLGIVPLLFTQVAYYRAFYPAGILIGWPWLLVIPLLVLAYYGAYMAATGVRHGWKPQVGIAAGWISAAIFLVLGFLFVNNFSLMANPARWPAIFARSNVAGAPTGLALNTADPTLLPRWLMMFGLAMVTVAVFIALDAVYLDGGQPAGYRGFASRAAVWVSTLGLGLFGLMGSWYISIALDTQALETALERPLTTAFFALAAGLPALTWAVLAVQYRGITRLGGVLAAVVQLLALGANAVARQWVQNMELAPYLNVASEPVRMQWSPLILFLALFVAGLVVVGWMIAKSWKPTGVLPRPHRGVRPGPAASRRPRGPPPPRRRSPATSA